MDVRIMDKHLKALTPLYLGTKFIKLDAEVSFNYYNFSFFFFSSENIFLLIYLTFV
jgi:hypothetical protein